METQFARPNKLDQVQIHNNHITKSTEKNTITTSTIYRLEHARALTPKNCTQLKDGKEPPHGHYFASC